MFCKYNRVLVLFVEENSQSFYISFFLDITLFDIFYGFQGCLDTSFLILFLYSRISLVPLFLIICLFFRIFMVPLYLIFYSSFRIFMIFTSIIQQVPFRNCLTLCFLLKNIWCLMFYIFFFLILFYGLFFITVSLFNCLSFLFWFIMIFCFFCHPNLSATLPTIAPFFSEHLMTFLALTVQWTLINCTWKYKFQG